MLPKGLLNLLVVTGMPLLGSSILEGDDCIPARELAGCDSPLLGRGLVDSLGDFYRGAACEASWEVVPPD